MSCSLLVTSAYLNSVRVDTQIGGNRESGVLFVGVDGGIYEFVFGSNEGNFKLFAIFDFVVCFDSDVPPHGDDSSPKNSILFFTFFCYIFLNLISICFIEMKNRDMNKPFLFCGRVSQLLSRSVKSHPGRMPSLNMTFFSLRCDFGATPSRFNTPTGTSTEIGADADDAKATCSCGGITEQYSIGLLGFGFGERPIGDGISPYGEFITEAASTPADASFADRASAF